MESWFAEGTAGESKIFNVAEFYFLIFEMFILRYKVFAFFCFTIFIKR